MFRVIAALAALVAVGTAQAKPIAFQDGATLMAEYGAGTMTEVQGFYAPRYWWSAGAGYLRLDAEDDAFSRDITYLRANLLIKRWNLPDAQANVFTWGSLGKATGSDFSGSVLAGNVGAQVDYETLHFYSSLRTDYQYSKAYAHRIDTLQLGYSLYTHDWDRLATWLVLQGRDFTGGLYSGGEFALLVRLFKGGAWIETGLTQDGKLQAMMMFNF